jgi:hypothetical protein
MTVVLDTAPPAFPWTQAMLCIWHGANVEGHAMVIPCGRLDKSCGTKFSRSM